MARYKTSLMVAMFDYEDRFTDSHETHEPIDYLKWLGSLSVWDGIISIAMFCAPVLARQFGPQENDRVVSFAIVISVILGMVARLTFGMRHIAKNHCDSLTKAFQKMLLGIVILSVVIVEVYVAVISAVPLAEEDFVFLAIVATIYIAVMLFVLYPGRRPLDMKRNRMK